MSFDLEDSVCVRKHLTHERAVYRSQGASSGILTLSGFTFRVGAPAQGLSLSSLGPTLFNKVSYLFQEDFSITILVDLFKEVG